MKVTKMLVLAALALSCAGCGENRQYLRLVSKDVYDGVNAMKTDAVQGGREANARYDNLHKFTVDLLKERQGQMQLSDQDLQDTLVDLNKERDEFRKAVGLNSRVDQMGDTVLYGLGWYEGPTDPLPVAGALAIGAGVGAAAVAAF